MLRPPPTSPLFPYTTLFRSPRLDVAGADVEDLARAHDLVESRQRFIQRRVGIGLVDQVHVETVGLQPPEALVRSEEHTSELQSLRHLVCRLLLEKKKKKRKQ